MGFSLSAFAGGAAAGLTEKFEEDRKIAQAAIVGRISRAAEINKRKLKETTELRSSLEEQLADITQVVGPDETLQKAFLTSPTAYATYKEQKLKGEALDPYKFITINKDKLFAGSSKDFIAKLTQEAAAPVAAAMPEAPTAEAKPTSFFAPSADRMKRYSESAAMSAGMTMEDVQRAESYTGLKKPESVATINFDTLMKPAKVVPVEDRMKAAMAAADDAKQTGNAEAFKIATDRYNNLKLLDTTLNPKQVGWADYVGQLKYKILKGTPEEKATANKELNEAIKIEQRDDKKKGEGTIPAESTMISVFRNAGAEAVRDKYGKALKDDLIVTTDPYGNSSFQYIGTNPTIQAEIRDTAKQGIARVASLYTTPSGVPFTRSVAAALIVNGINIGEGGAAMFPSGPRTTTVPPPATGGGATAAPATSSVKPSPKTRAEYDALPPGTIYIDVDGKTKTKGATQ